MDFFFWWIWLLGYNFTPCQRYLQVEVAAIGCHDWCQFCENHCKSSQHRRSWAAGPIIAYSNISKSSYRGLVLGFEEHRQNPKRPNPKRIIVAQKSGLYLYTLFKPAICVLDHFTFQTSASKYSHALRMRRLLQQQLGFLRSFTRISKESLVSPLCSASGKL